jgi:membrane protein required for colicin V production
MDGRHLSSLRDRELGMNLVDVTVLTLLLAGTLVGVLWGAVRETVALVGLALGLFIAGRTYEPLAQLLSRSGIISSLNWARIVGFVGVTLVVWAVLAVGAAALRVFLRAPALGALDKVAGAALGFVLALVMVTSMLIAAITFPVPGLTQDAYNSRVAQTFGGFMPVVLALMPPEFDAVQTNVWWYPR